MRNLFVFSVLVAAAMMIYADTSSAQATPSQPDLSGVWLRAGDRNPFDLPLDLSILQPAAKTKFAAERNGHGPNVVLDFASNTDPFIKSCDPLGLPRVLLANHPFKMIPAAGEMIILYERSHDFREIYMDGRGHPADLDPSWWGHSTGKWQGDTLVVDSVGFNDRTWLDYQGLPHSEALHLVERYRRLNHDSLQLVLTIDDPKAYTKTWEVTNNYGLKPWDIGEDICVVANEKHFEQGIVTPGTAPIGK